MNCKYCDALLEEGVTVCPACGKDVTEETIAEAEISEEVVADAEQVAVEEVIPETVENEAKVEENAEAEGENVEEEELLDETEAKERKPLAWWKAALMGAGVMLVVILLAFAILRSQGVDPMSWFTPKETTSEQSGTTDNTNTEGGTYTSQYPLNRDSYTADEEKAAEQAAQVVAKCGDNELTNAELQIYYWSGVYEFINNYQHYLESVGLDLTKPFDEQEAMDGVTWQKFFLENAIFNWHKFSALAQEAEKVSFTLSSESQQMLDTMQTQMEEVAASGGYTSATEMLTTEMGALVSVESYANYSGVYYMAMEYFNAEYEKLQPTDQQLEEYFAQHETELAASGVTKDSMKYAVRHILLEPEGGTEDANGMMTYTDAEWEACLKKAQAMLDEWKANDGTENGFAELAKNHSTDGGSSSNGGLYTDLDASTNFVEEFKNWYLDENRKVGDTGIVQSVYGYHIMYQSAADTNWQDTCREALLTELSEAFVQNAMDAYEVEIDDEKIAIGHVTLQAQ